MQVFKSLRWAIPVALAMLVWPWLCLGAPPGKAAPSPATLPNLQRGVNLSHWLTYYGRQPIVQADMTRIASAGFDHVRINFDPGLLGWNPDSRSNSASLPQISKLDNAVNMALQAGLVAVLDFHPSATLKQRIEKETSVQSAFINLWGTLAKRYKSRPQDKLVYEILNEPQYWDGTGPKPWFELRNRALASIRKQDPGHLVLLSGSYGGGLRGLLEDQPVNDPAVAHTIHYYEPYLFTHLGAPWEPHLSRPEGMFTGLAYPASSSTWESLTLKPGVNEAVVRAAFDEYKDQNWGYDRILQDLTLIQNWAATNKAKVICNEFGVVRIHPTPVTDPAYRSAWLRDMRNALSAKGLGWTVWDYADIFGIAVATGNTYLSSDGAVIPSDTNNPVREWNPGDLEALGMTVTAK